MVGVKVYLNPFLLIGGASLRCDSVTYYRYAPLSRLDLLASKKKRCEKAAHFFVATQSRTIGTRARRSSTCLPLRRKKLTTLGYVYNDLHFLMQKRI